jgi:hypothetical protein
MKRKMETEIFEQEWQRVAVDKAPTHYDQLQDLLDFAAGKQHRSYLTQGEINVIYAQQFIQRVRDVLWQNRSDW